MNKMRRTRLEKSISKLLDVRDELETLRDEEQEYVDNAPENLQYSERYEQAQEYADAMSDAYDELDSIIAELQEIVEDSY